MSNPTNLSRHIMTTSRKTQYDVATEADTLQQCRWYTTILILRINVSRSCFLLASPPRIETAIISSLSCITLSSLLRSYSLCRERLQYFISKSEDICVCFLTQFQQNHKFCGYELHMFRGDLLGSVRLLKVTVYIVTLTQGIIFTAWSSGCLWFWSNQITIS